LEFRRVLFRSTLFVAVVITISAIVGKFLAFYFTQKIYGYSLVQRDVIFGLSYAQAAATLATVLVGYNIVMGYDVDGEPIRLLNESVLNGSIFMILVTCTLASFIAQRGATKLAIEEMENIGGGDDEENSEEKILIPI